MPTYAFQTPIVAFQIPTVTFQIPIVAFQIPTVTFQIPIVAFQTAFYCLCITMWRNFLLQKASREMQPTGVILLI
jgi:hypothetical protein